MWCSEIGFLKLGSMYGIYTYIWLIFMVNVAKYTIHGSYGKGLFLNQVRISGNVMSVWGWWVISDEVCWSLYIQVVTSSGCDDKGSVPPNWHHSGFRKFKLPETNIGRTCPKRKLIFELAIFRGKMAVRFRKGSNLPGKIRRMQIQPQSLTNDRCDPLQTLPTKRKPDRLNQASWLWRMDGKKSRKKCKNQLWPWRGLNHSRGV